MLTRGATGPGSAETTLTTFEVDCGGSFVPGDTLRLWSILVCWRLPPVVSGPYCYLSWSSPGKDRGRSGKVGNNGDIFPKRP